MALSIRNEEADRLARRLAKATGESLTDAVTNSLIERLERVTSRKRRAGLVRDLEAIAKRCTRLPVLDEPSGSDSARTQSG